MNYAEDSRIDINALDIEWLNLPTIEERYIEQVRTCKEELTDAIENEKLIQEELKTKRSELIQQVQVNPSKYVGKDKINAQEAEAYYRTHKDYIKIKKEVIEAEMAIIRAEDAHNTAKDMKDLIHFTKTKALESLTILHGQGYFAGPKVPRDLNRELERYNEKKEQLDERSRKIGKGLRRNK